MFNCPQNGSHVNFPYQEDIKGHESVLKLYSSSCFGYFTLQYNSGDSSTNYHH